MRLSSRSTCDDTGRNIFLSLFLILPLFLLLFKCASEFVFVFLYNSIGSVSVASFEDEEEKLLKESFKALAAFSLRALRLLRSDSSIPSTFPFSFSFSLPESLSERTLVLCVVEAVCC